MDGSGLARGGGRFTMLNDLLSIADPAYVIRRDDAVLRKAFGDAVLVDQVLPSNPVERAKRPRMQRAEPGKVWTAGELRAFLEVARRHRLFAFYHLAAYTGARRGELLNLRWRDVDLDGELINIKGSASFVDGNRIEGTTKSGRSRVVSIDGGTVEVLRGHRRQQRADRLGAGEAWKGTSENDFVFATTLGEPVHPDTVSSLMTILIENHNAPKQGAKPAEPLPHARLHDMRHIHATTLLPPGSDTRTRPSRSASTRT